MVWNYGAVEMLLLLLYKIIMFVNQVLRQSSQ